MISQGLSDWAKAQLKFLRAANAIPDTDLGTIVSMALALDDKQLDAKQREQESKLLQLFIDKKLYAQVYKDELNQPMQAPGKEIRPEHIDMEALAKLIGG